MFPNLYKKGKYDLAKDLINELYKNIEPSNDKWDRGFNAGLSLAIRRLQKYRSEFERKYNIEVEG